MTPDPSAFYETLAASAASFAAFIGAVLGSRVIDRLNRLFDERKRIEEDIAVVYVAELLGPNRPETEDLYRRLLGTHVDRRRTKTLLGDLVLPEDDPRREAFNRVRSQDNPQLQKVNRWAANYRGRILPWSYVLMFAALFSLTVTGVAVPLYLLYRPVASPTHLLLLKLFFCGLLILIVAFAWMLVNVWQVRYVSWPRQDQLDEAREEASVRRARFGERSRPGQ